MRLLIVAFASLIPLSAQPPDARNDSGLAALIPSNTQLLTGVQMDTLRNTPLYMRLATRQRMEELDEFSRRTGFDPRRDVRYLVAASNGVDSLVIARGAFPSKPAAGMKRSSYRGVILHTGTAGGYAVIDPTLAIAGPEPRLREAIDRKLSRGSPPVVLAQAALIPANAQLWMAGSAFTRPPASGGAGMSGFLQLLTSVERMNLWADVRTGLVARVNGVCRSEEDAKKLRDSLRGFIGLARLSVPEKQPEMLRFYDRFKAEQRGNAVDLNIDVPPELLDAFIRFAERDRPATPGKR
jgi:hypothetical protein